MNFISALFALASVAMAVCPTDVLLRSAKLLTGNYVNAINQKNLALLIGAIASPDATADVRAYNEQARVCQSAQNLPFPLFASDAINSNIKFVQANITDAFQTEVGYTVVMVHALDDRGLYTTQQFNYMDPQGTCNLQLITAIVSEDRCPA